MNFPLGVAARLYEQRVHPRVLLSARDLGALKRRVHSGTGRKIMDGVRARVRLVLDHVRAAQSSESLLQAPLADGHFGARVLIALDDLAFVGVVDGNAEANEAVRRVWQAVFDAEPLSSPADRQPYSFGGLRHLALAYDLLFGRTPPDERQRIAEWLLARSVRATLDRLRGSYLRNAGANTPMCGMMSALLALLAVEGDPGVPDLAAERAELLHMLEASLHTALGPDGYPVEDIGYGTAVMAYLAVVVEAVRRAGWYDAYRECQRLRRFGRAMLHFVQPWGGCLSNTGDHGDDFLDRGFVLARLATETRDASLLWLLGTLFYPPGAAGHWSERQQWYGEVRLGKSVHIPACWLSLAVFDDLRRPVPPAKAKLPTHFVDRGRGIVSFRSGWDAEATFVVFDGSQPSPAAQRHAHDSGGHFSLSALGEYFAIDTGRYSTEQDQHNVVLVDGKSGRSTGGEWRMSFYHAQLTGCMPGRFVDCASVDDSHQANCYWARRYLGLVKGKDTPAYVWTVEDVNAANDYREFWWTLHTCPSNHIETGADRATIRGRKFGHRLELFFALPDPSAFPKPHTIALTQDVQRCGSPNYVDDEEVRRRVAELDERGHEMVHGPLFQRPRGVAKVAGYNGRFLTLMIPLRNNEPSPRVERLASLDNSLAVRITFERCEDILVWTYEHNLLEADRVRERGQWCLIRRRTANGRLLARIVSQADDPRWTVADRSRGGRAPISRQPQPRSHRALGRGTSQLSP